MSFVPALCNSIRDVKFVNSLNLLFKENPKPFGASIDVSNNVLFYEAISHTFHNLNPVDRTCVSMYVMTFGIASYAIYNPRGISHVGNFINALGVNPDNIFPEIALLYCADRGLKDLFIFETVFEELNKLSKDQIAVVAYYINLIKNHWAPAALTDADMEIYKNGTSRIKAIDTLIRNTPFYERKFCFNEIMGESTKLKRIINRPPLLCGLKLEEYVRACLRGVSYSTKECFAYLIRSLNPSRDSDYKSFLNDVFKGFDLRVDAVDTIIKFNEEDLNYFFFRRESTSRVIDLMIQYMKANLSNDDLDYGNQKIDYKLFTWLIDIVFFTNNKEDFSSPMFVRFANKLLEIDFDLYENLYSYYTIEDRLSNTEKYAKVKLRLW